ncbi:MULTISPECIES: hypothetical protein [unclassified Bacteroides]|uniref:hypothetical protein n=1 Tax=unclassified Bacteroides TaxID=2646097 RepID=UPI001E304FB8|nr:MULTISPECIES: hypothetical protein [unclassified Bacteroides]
MCRLTECRSCSWDSMPASPWLSRVALGMAIALCPAESIAQQSEQPSVMKSSSPGRSSRSTGRL